MRVLIISAACNGYQWRYQALLHSHEAYAKRFGYEYIAYTHPVFSSLGRECAWLKVPLLQSALEQGYDWVVWLDADTLVRNHCPPIEKLPESDKAVYAVKGYSGRLNSGVMFLKQSVQARSFLAYALKISDRPLPLEVDIGWGENGHLIQAALEMDCVLYLDARWNNNTNPALEDYIRHFSAGPLQEHFKPSPKQQLLSQTLDLFSRLLRLPQRVIAKVLPSLAKRQFHNRLSRLSNKALRYHRYGNN